VKHRPVVPGDRPMTVSVSDEESGWQEWTQVPDFAASGPTDRHFVLDAVAGEISFGPAVREPDGAVRQYGAIPPKGAASGWTPTSPEAAGRQPRPARDQRPEELHPLRLARENRRSMAAASMARTSRTQSCAARSRSVRGDER